MFGQVENKLQFAELIAAITMADEREAAVASKAANSEIKYLARASKEKLVAKCIDVSKLTKKEMHSLLVAYYGVSDKWDNNKMMYW
jgi:hypothetical protein